MPNANLGPTDALAVRIANIERRLANMATSPTLLNASTGQGDGVPGILIDTDGVHAFDETGMNITAMLTADGSVTAYDTTGAPVARFGPLTNSNPGAYGVEVLVGGAWAQVGAGTVTWANISGKPSTFTPSAHTHPGSDITSAVANATNATTATSASNASTADGSSYAFNNNVGGTSFFAVWVGNDSGNHLGKNTSSIRYKTNVRRHFVAPADVLALKPVLYDRLGSGVTEYGLIAEQVAETMPELVQWFNGHIDNVRYDLLSVALLDVVRTMAFRLNALETMVTNALADPAAPPDGTAAHYAPPVLPSMYSRSLQCNNPPALRPAPLPYTIQPQFREQAQLGGDGSLDSLTLLPATDTAALTGGGSLTAF